MAQSPWEISRLKDRLDAILDEAADIKRTIDNAAHEARSIYGYADGTKTPE
jgi:hypothetical protein